MNRAEGWAPYPGAATPFQGIAKGAIMSKSTEPGSLSLARARRQVEKWYLLEGKGIAKWNGPYWRSESASDLDRFEYRPNGRDEPHVAIKR